MSLSPSTVLKASAALERNVLAVVVGYITAVIFVVLSFGVLMRIWPGLFPNPATGVLLGVGALAVALALNLFFAAVGGYVSALIAMGNRRRVAVILGLVMIVLGILTMLLEKGVKPLWWYGIFFILLVPCTVFGASLVEKKSRPPKSGNISCPV